MDLIPFTYNWNNKLNCSAFTTIRIYNQTKHYVGNRVEITLKGSNEKRFGTIMAVKPFLLHHLTPFMSYLDTGYSVGECQKIISKMYPTIDLAKKQFAFILILKDK